jgi:hypothetical protein
MVDYSKAAFDLKARLNAKAKRRVDLDAFFEGVRVNIVKEVEKANVELLKEGAPTVDLQLASPFEHTIELACRNASCKISQDRSVPSIGAIIAGEAGEKTVTFLILVNESPVKARRINFSTDDTEKADPTDLAATFVEELIVGAP